MGKPDGDGGATRSAVGTEDVVASPGAEPSPSSPPAPVDPPRAGDHVGRYTLQALIGTGGMGSVFAAHDPQLGRNVAVKIVRPGRGGGRARVRMLREARALARLHHPNVVTIHDAGAQGEQIFIAMELVEG